MSNVPVRCPFCGSDQIGFSRADVGVDCGSVGCEKCQCEGPIGGNEIRAVAAWNRRDPAAIVPDAGNKVMVGPIRTMLKQYRALSDVDQKDLADEIGISASSLCRFEKGKSLDERGTIRMIAWLFGTNNNAGLPDSKKPRHPFG